MTTNFVRLLMVASTLGGMAPVLAQTKTSPPPQTATTTTASEVSGPKIQFAERAYDFGKISQGEVVNHEFVFTNTGTATLEIKDVRTACGCTTAGNWDRRVEPGKTGVIPLQFNSHGFMGNVTKPANVTCNDPARAQVELQFKGTIWKPIEVTPPVAVFNVTSESYTNEIRVVRIVSNLDEAIELSDLQCTNRSFRAELKTVRAGKEFELYITAIPPFEASPVRAPVSLKTSWSRMPTINVSAYVTVQPPVIVTPRQIMLPPGPLASVSSPAVTILNNGTNSLVLSDASVYNPDAKVRVQEIQPGRQFSLTVNFPAGFQIKRGEQVDVSIKSNHPRFPVLKVPIFQPQPFPAQSSAAPAAAQSGEASSRTTGK
jgi:hypothetical protein